MVYPDNVLINFLRGIPDAAELGFFTVNYLKSQRFPGHRRNKDVSTSSVE